MTEWQRAAIYPEPFLLIGILESDGNLVDGNETYSWTEDAAKLFYVMTRAADMRN